MQRVYVTGMGVVSALGHGRAAFGAALEAGRCAAAPVEAFDTSTLNRHRACPIRDFAAADFLSRSEVDRTGRCGAFALAAARMAVQDAALPAAQLRQVRAATILGTTMGEANVLAALQARWLHQGEQAMQGRQALRYGSALLPIHVARALGLRGPVQTLPAACAAGNYAIGYAADLIQAGRVDVAVTGASEVINRLQYAGFARLGAMAPEICQPFDQQRQGLLLGEGAAVLVLESEAHLTRRGGRALAEVGGYGLACDAHHITRPHPEGEGSVRAMRDAMRRSGLGPRDISFINAHGTGTQANDPTECQVIRTVFSNDAPPVTSIKSMLGHTMGAASALEAVSCVLSLERQKVPPTIHLQAQDEACPVDVVTQAPRVMPVQTVLNNALAFGGYDAVLCLAQPGLLAPPTERRAALQAEAC